MIFLGVLVAGVSCAAALIHSALQPSADATAARTSTTFDDWSQVSAAPPLEARSWMAQRDGRATLTILDADISLLSLADAARFPANGARDPGDRTLATITADRLMHTAAGQDDTDGPAFGRPTAPIDRFMSMGLDGLVITLPTHADAISDALAIRLQRAIDHMRWLKPDAMALVSGNEAVVARTDLLRRLDGVVKHHLLTPATANGAGRDRRAAIAASRHFLDRVVRRGKPVFVFERVQTVSRGQAVAAALTAMGYLPHVGVRTTTQHAGRPAVSSTY